MPKARLFVSQIERGCFARQRRLKAVFALLSERHVPMAVSRPRVKLFTGSPLSSDLDWDDSALINTFIASFQVLLDRDGPIAERDHEETLLLSATSPRWRNVSIRANARLQSGFSQPFLPSGGYSSNPNISFSAPPYADSFESVPEDTTVPEASYQPSTFVERDDPFLEHALAFHETLLSSQIAPVAVPEATSFTSFLTTSFGTTTTRDSTQPVEMKSSDQGTRDFVIPQSLQITPLSSLPSSAHLIAIHPQTPTPTLLCALISKSSPRIVQIRRTGGHMQLHEIIVRDETKSNLSISFWLPPLAQETHGNKFLNVTEYQQQPLRKTLEDLRIGDIVLLRNVALTAYRGVVYGNR